MDREFSKTRNVSKRKSEGNAVEIINELKQRRKVVGATTRVAKHTTSGEDRDTVNSLVSDRIPFAVRTKGQAGGRNPESVRVSRVEEYEEDPGRIESQQFLNLAKIVGENKDSSGRANTYLKVFVKAIEEQEQELTDSIENQESNIKMRNTEFLDSYRAAYSTVLSTECIHTSALLTLNHDKSAHTLYQKSEKVTNTAAILSRLFQRSAAGIESYSNVPFDEAKWEIDINETKYILAVGKDVGERKIEGILGITQNEEADPRTVGISDLLFENPLDASADVTWATVAKEQERIVRKLLRILSQE